MSRKQVFRNQLLLCWAAGTALLFFSSWAVHQSVAAKLSNPGKIKRLLAEARQQNEDAKDFYGEYLPSDKFPNDTILQGDILQEGFGALIGLGLDAIRDKSRLWPNGRVPYEIADNLKHYEKKLIAAAIDEFTAKTCIRFVPRKLEVNYVRFQPSEIGCFSTSVGEKQGEQQAVYLAPACFREFGKILHEMMHVVGFYHEQMRTDRDQYITINYTNIRRLDHPQFEKLYDDKIDDLGLPYDYGSLLHYGPYGFAIDPSVPVITPTRPLPENVKGIGQRDNFSDLDIKKLNILYSCNKKYECASDEVPCSDGQQNSCARKCDGIAQCSDGSDETNCPRPSCSKSDYWPCNTFKCIPKSSVCDGTRDCLGGEDELPENCKERKCGYNQFKCNSGKCIPDFRRCDGVFDCLSGEDENKHVCDARRRQVVEQNIMRGPTQYYNPCGAGSNFFTGFGFLQYFGQPQCSPYGGFGLGYDPPAAGKLPQRHCFLDVASLSERPEIRVSAEAASKLLGLDKTDAESACSVMALGYANVVVEKNDSITLELPRMALDVVKLLQRAQAVGKIDGFVVVTNSFNEFRTIGSDVAKAKKFAEAVRSQLRKLNATGILIEWLRPMPSDKAALNTILKTLAETMQYDPDLKTPKFNGVRLLIGLNVLPTIKAAHDKDLILKNVDYLNVIPDVKEELKSKRTVYVNRLLSSLAAKDDAKGGSTWLSSDNATLRRINIGVQVAPISWTLSRFQTEVGGPVKSPGLNGPISGTPGRLNTAEMCLIGEPKRVAGYAEHRALRKFRMVALNGTENAYAYSEPDQQWIAYETPSTLVTKLRKAKTDLMALNGIYITDMQADDPRGLCGASNSFALTKTLLRFSEELRMSSVKAG